MDRNEQQSVPNSRSAATPALSGAVCSRRRVHGGKVMQIGGTQSQRLAD